jgi:hypothetical protein
VHSTPKLPPSNGKSRSTQHKPVFSKETNSAFRSPSPRKYTGRNPLAASQSSTGPSTPNAYADNTQDLFSSSPFEAGSAARPTPNPDTVLHRNVLDKNYRIQATPHSQRKQHTTTLGRLSRLLARDLRAPTTQRPLLSSKTTLTTTSATTSPTPTSHPRNLPPHTCES